MSLKIWLPLCNGINNQGTFAVNNVTKSAFVAQTNGKLGGKTYSGYSIYKFTDTNDPLPDNKWSIMTWFRSAAFSVNHDIILCKNTSTSNDTQFYFSTVTNGTKLNLGINGSSSGYDVSYTFNTDTWYHVAATYDGTTVCMYINGIKVKEATCTRARVNAPHLGIGSRSSSSDGTSAVGAGSYRFNDVRIYDEALTPKQIKEIAKGLVAHYPFKDPYIEPTTNLVTSITAGGNTSVVDEVITTLGKNADTFFYPVLSEGIVAGTTYTISCDAEIPEGLSWTFGIGGTNVPHMFTVINGHNEYTFTASSSVNWAGSSPRVLFDDAGAMSARTGTKTKIYNLQIEKKNHATPYTKTSRELGIVQDTSGYGYHGTTTEEAYPILSDDTPRFNRCWHFDGVDKYAMSGYINTVGFTNSYSISWWGKADLTSKMPWAIIGGGMIDIYNGRYLNTGDGTSNPFYKPGTTDLIDMVSSTEFHHFVMTGDGTESRIYIDGELAGIAKTYKPLPVSTPRFYFNGTDGTTYRTDIYMSDFRIYSTVLSEDDVRELYNSPISITKDGNLMMQGELIEL